MMDFTAGAIFAALGTSAMMMWNVPAIILETLLLKLVLDISYRRALKNAFVINIASTILGYLALKSGILLSLYSRISTRVGMDYNYDVGRNFSYYFGALYVIGLVISALVEGVVLIRLEPKLHKSELWLASWGINALSYAICPFIFGVMVPAWVNSM